MRNEIMRYVNVIRVGKICLEDNSIYKPGKKKKCFPMYHKLSSIGAFCRNVNGKKEN